MPLLSFQKRFADAVENSVEVLWGPPSFPHPGVRPKRQTIRAYRKDGRDPRPGQILHLYTGPYDHRRRKIGEVECLSVQRIQIRGLNSIRLVVEGEWKILSAEEREELAQADGFGTAREFFDYIATSGGLPLKGLLIRW